MATILLIDDNPKIRAITRMMLETADHEVVEAANGEEGLKMLESERPNLVLLDVMMPGENGWRVCKDIKANEKTRGIPVVMLTVRGSTEDINQSSESGADEHISKPFDMEYLLDTVERQLRKTESP